MRLGDEEGLVKENMEVIGDFYGLLVEWWRIVWSGYRSKWEERYWRY